MKPKGDDITELLNELTQGKAEAQEPLMMAIHGSCAAWQPPIYGGNAMTTRSRPRRWSMKRSCGSCSTPAVAGRIAPTSLPLRRR